VKLCPAGMGWKPKACRSSSKQRSKGQTVETKSRRLASRLASVEGQLDPVITGKLSRAPGLRTAYISPARLSRAGRFLAAMLARRQLGSVLVNLHTSRLRWNQVQTPWLLVLFGHPRFATKAAVGPCATSFRSPRRRIFPNRILHLRASVARLAPWSPLAADNPAVSLLGS